MKVPYTKNIHKLLQGPPNPGFRSAKVQTETFLKKDSRDFKNYLYLGFLRIPSKTGKHNWKVPFFLGIHNCKKISVYLRNAVEYVQYTANVSPIKSTGKPRVTGGTP
jgi:hypothetical protein